MTAIDFPFIVLHGTADNVIPMKGSQELYETSATPKEDKTLVIIEGAEHNLVVIVIPHHSSNINFPLE